MAPAEKIGIIAGGGQFPLLFARAAKKAGRSVVVIAHRGETTADIAAVADSLYWIKLGQLGKIITLLHKEQVKETVLAGTITKTRIFRDVFPDIKALTLWKKITTHQDDALLRAVAETLEEAGITVRASTIYLNELLFPRGVLTQKKPDREQLADITFGWRTARAIGEQDIGQTVVVRHQTVLAVEAIEGTDAAIKRGGALGNQDAVVVKVKKPQQDIRFDLPAIGPTTIASMREVGAKVLAVEAGQSLLFDPDQTVRAADKAGIVMVGIAEAPDGTLVMD